MSKTDYAQQYRNIDFRKRPDKYVIGRGEQGVLIAEPYKSEILPYWKFATPADAKTSSNKIYAMFCDYKKAKDFVGMDMARKFLQMGWTRSRRYANHTSGKKYDNKNNVRSQDVGSEQSDKAESAKIFFEQYQKAKSDADYLRMKDQHNKNNRA